MKKLYNYWMNYQDINGDPLSSMNYYNAKDAREWACILLICNFHDAEYCIFKSDNGRKEYRVYKSELV